MDRNHSETVLAKSLFPSPQECILLHTIHSRLEKRISVSGAWNGENLHLLRHLTLPKIIDILSYGVELCAKENRGD